MVDVDGLRMREEGGTEADHSRRDRRNGHIIDLDCRGRSFTRKMKKQEWRAGGAEFICL